MKPLCLFLCLAFGSFTTYAQVQSRKGVSLPKKNLDSAKVKSVSPIQRKYTAPQTDQVNQPVTNTTPVNTTTPVGAPVYSTELIRAHQWWSRINPTDYSIYDAIFKVSTHTTGETMIGQFASKTSISFKGIYNPDAWSSWKPDSLVHLQALTQLKQVNLGATFINDSSFYFLGRIPSLRAVYYNDGIAQCSDFGLEVTDTGFANLLQNTDLEYLGLKNLKKITDQGFSAISKLNKLKVLYLCCWNISDTALLSLQGCTSLETLYLISTNVTDAGLYNLLSIKSSLPNLKVIYVNFSKTTRQGEQNFTASWGKPIGIIY